MRTFKEIHAISAERHGGEAELEKLLRPPLPPDEVAAIPDDRWLSTMARCVFNAGFNWKVVDAMWPGFEEVFEGFVPQRVAMFNEDDFDRLVQDKRIVRHGTKIRSVQENAMFVMDLAKEHGSAAEALGRWPTDDYIGLLDMLKKRGTRLGGNTGQYFLRFMNRDGFLLSVDVVGRLIAEGVIDKPPTSKAALKNVQEAFNGWHLESGRSYKEISAVVARSIG